MQSFAILSVQRSPLFAQLEKKLKKEAINLEKPVFTPALNVAFMHFLFSHKPAKKRTKYANFCPGKFCRTLRQTRRWVLLGFLQTEAESQSSFWEKINEAHHCLFHRSEILRMLNPPHISQYQKSRHLQKSLPSTVTLRFVIK